MYNKFWRILETRNPAKVKLRFFVRIFLGSCLSISNFASTIFKYFLSLTAFCLKQFWFFLSLTMSRKIVFLFGTIFSLQKPYLADLYLPNIPRTPSPPGTTWVLLPNWPLADGRCDILAQPLHWRCPCASRSFPAGNSVSWGPERNPIKKKFRLRWLKVERVVF